MPLPNPRAMLPSGGGPILPPGQGAPAQSSSGHHSSGFPMQRRDPLPAGRTPTHPRECKNAVRAASPFFALHRLILHRLAVRRALWRYPAGWAARIRCACGRRSTTAAGRFSPPGSRHRWRPHRCRRPRTAPASRRLRSAYRGLR